MINMISKLHNLIKYTLYCKPKEPEEEQSNIDKQTPRARSYQQPELSEFLNGPKLLYLKDSIKRRI